MDSSYLRLNGNNLSHIQAYVRSLCRVGMSRAIVKCVPRGGFYKFVVFETLANGQDKMQTFDCFGSLVKAYPNANVKGFKLILDIPGAGHYDVLKVTDLKACMSSPPPRYARPYKIIELCSSDTDETESEQEKPQILNLSPLAKCDAVVASKTVNLETKSFSDCVTDEDEMSFRSISGSCRKGYIIDARLPADSSGIQISDRDFLR